MENQEDEKRYSEVVLKVRVMDTWGGTITKEDALKQLEPTYYPPDFECKAEVLEEETERHLVRG